MARPGDELINPVIGLRTVFWQLPEDSDGALQVEWIGEPRWTTGVDHVHPRQEERFEELWAGWPRVDDTERILGAGDVVLAAAGAPHAAWIRHRRGPRAGRLLARAAHRRSPSTSSTSPSSRPSTTRKRAA